jgi:predicted nucleic acid-binding protein
MATTAAEPVFVDTNVLVYANVTSAPAHKSALETLTRFHRSGAPLWISRQVIREYVATLTRPQTFAIPDLATVIADVRFLLQHFHVADDTAAVTDHLLTLNQEVTVGGKQVHDANIVATMQANGVHLLLTFNAADFTRFGERITLVNPEENEEGAATAEGPVQ